MLFFLQTSESLSSHIFRAFYAVNSYQNIKTDKIKSDLGHTFAYTKYLNKKSYKTPLTINFLK